jgi:hypothetical protein
LQVFSAVPEVPYVLLKEERKPGSAWTCPPDAMRSPTATARTPVQVTVFFLAIT